MLGLQHFSFEAVWSPLTLMVYVIIGAAYLLLTGPYRTIFPDSEPVSWQRKTLFISGLFLFYFAQTGPLEILAHLMFSAHMIAMTVSYIIAPPLLLLGTPAWMWRPVLKLRIVKPLKIFTHPIISIGLFNGLFSFYHFPAILDYVMVHYTLHTILYAVLFVTSLLMWWPIVCPVPEYNRLSELQKMAYIFIAGFLLTPACALIIFAPDSLYQTYSNPEVWAVALAYCVPGDPSSFLAAFQGPGFFSSLSPVDHQQIGGISMKLIQEVLYISILGWVFYHWFRKEKKRNETQDDEAAILEWKRRMNQV